MDKLYLKIRQKEIVDFSWMGLGFNDGLPGNVGSPSIEKSPFVLGFLNKSMKIKNHSFANFLI